MTRPARPVALQEGEGGGYPWLLEVYRIYDGISVSPWDLIKAPILGLLTNFAISTTGIKVKDATDGFLKGFIFGGAIAGFEDLADSLVKVAYGLEDPEWTVHEIFQGILLQGIISGAIVAGISALGK